MGMVTDKPHRNDKANLQSTQRPCDFAARFRPVYWVFLGPGSEGIWEHDNWLTENHKGHINRTGLQILQIYKECGHPVVLGTSIFEQGSLRSK